MTIDNETWLIDRGDEIIEKKAENGMQAISPWEKLVYCLWVADYSIRNAGDLEMASDLYEDYRVELLYLAHQQGLTKTATAFALSDEDLVREYGARFNEVCEEIRRTEPID